MIKGRTKIIIQGQKDSNGDKVYNENDPTIPLVVDINSGKPAVETFGQDFMDSLKLKLMTIWKH